MKKLSNYEVFDDNPIKKQGFVVKYRKIKGNTKEVVELDTGVMATLTSAGTIVTFIEDTLQFRKVYDELVENRRKLPLASQLVLDYVLKSLVPKKDYVLIDIYSCMEFCGYKSDTSVYDGIKGLLEIGWLYRSTSEKKYWINVNVMFNGKRITKQDIENFKNK